MDKAKLEKLNKIMNIVKKDFVSASDVKSFLVSVLAFAKENKENLENLSKEYLQNIQDAINHIELQNNKFLSEIKNETTQTKQELLFIIKEAEDFLKEVKKIKATKGKDGKDGLDADEEVIIEKVLEKIVLPEYKETVLDGGEDIVIKINDLPITEENQIDAKHIKNLPEMKGGKFYGGSGIKEIVAGTNITVDNTNLGYPVINAIGGLSETFESISKNIKAYPYVITYTVGGDIDYITYDLGGGLEVVKTFGYTSGDVTTIILSGDTPVGIDLIKTLSYSGGAVDNVVYS